MAATFGFIHKTVAAAATPERLSATSQLVASVIIQAKGGDNTNTGANTGKVFVGPSTVTNAGTTGIQLPAPSAGTVAPTIRIDSNDPTNPIDLTDIWIAVATNGEGVVAFYYTR